LSRIDLFGLLLSGRMVVDHRDSFKPRPDATKYRSASAACGIGNRSDASRASITKSDQPSAIDPPRFYFVSSIRI